MIAVDAASISYIFAAVGLLAGIGGGIAAFRKAGPESSHILVDAATDVVLIQKDLVESVQSDLRMLKTRVQELEEQRRLVEDEAVTLRRENAKLLLRITVLEEQLANHARRLASEEKRNNAIEAQGRATDVRAEEHGQSRHDEHENKRERKS